MAYNSAYNKRTAITSFYGFANERHMLDTAARPIIGIVDIPLTTKSTSENAYRPTELLKSESYNGCYSYA